MKFILNINGNTWTFPTFKEAIDEGIRRWTGKEVTTITDEDNRILATTKYRSYLTDLGKKIYRGGN